MQHGKMRADGDLPEQRGLGIRFGQLGRRTFVAGEYQQVVGEAEGEGSLADPERSGEQQCMRQFAGPIGSRQHRSRLAMAEEIRGFGRFGDAIERVVLFGCDTFEHQAPCTASWSACDRASSAAKTAAVTAFSTISASTEASTTAHRFGSFLAMSRKAWRRRLWMASVSFS